MKVILKLAQYSLVGMTGMILDFGITYYLTEKRKINKYISNSIGFSCAVLNNFLLNKFWTFQETHGSFSYQLILFAGIALGGSLINHQLLYFLHNRCRIGFYLAKAFVICFLTLWNFTLNYLFTFE